MIIMKAHELLAQFDEHLGQLNSDKFTEVTQITDEEGTKMHVPDEVEYLIFEDKDDMFSVLTCALDCAIVETDKQEVD